MDLIFHPNFLNEKRTKMCSWLFKKLTSYARKLHLRSCECDLMLPGQEEEDMIKVRLEERIVVRPSLGWDVSLGQSIKRKR